MTETTYVVVYDNIWPKKENYIDLLVMEYIVRILDTNEEFKSNYYNS